MIVGFLRCNCENFIIGALQLISAPILIGWVWSIWWGFDLVEVSKNRRLGIL
ncbi:unnamed protein product [Hapterophycus canaliculatus]